MERGKNLYKKELTEGDEQRQGKKRGETSFWEVFSKHERRGLKKGGYEGVGWGEFEDGSDKVFNVNNFNYY